MGPWAGEGKDWRELASNLSLAQGQGSSWLKLCGGWGPSGQKLGDGGASVGADWGEAQEWRWVVARHGVATGKLSVIDLASKLWRKHRVAMVETQCNSEPNGSQYMCGTSKVSCWRLAQAQPQWGASFVSGEVLVLLSSTVLQCVQFKWAKTKDITGQILGFEGHLGKCFALAGVFTSK
ncbi:hypothetical protein GUJ93_ZPchr0010g7542 [Zizania palustris]|uniref:Uncharacterized protein n=1 Tax=Zizania palustris TaxID=103762 RepID=A0A8J6BGJ1_ZIZPA|nr:hypothetical protein GUJ93_ZPchr0010g7542 [Zizania palustris]